MSINKFWNREYPIAKQLGMIHMFHSVERVLNIKCKRSNYKIAQKHHALMRRFLDCKFSSFTPSLQLSGQDHLRECIWVLWLQGEENAPQLVKKCISSIRKHANGHPVILLTADNITEYVHFPEYIQKKYAKGIITNQNYSDLIRFYLLSHYGGLWCDATIFITAPLPQEIFLYDFYSGKQHVYSEIADFVPDGKWCAFLLESKPGNNITTLEYELMLHYWKDEEHLVDYYLVDYIMDYLYRHNEECRKLIDKVPYNNQDIFKVVDNLNVNVSSHEFENLIQNNVFQKLSWRVTPSNDSQTYYNRLINLLR